MFHYAYDEYTWELTNDPVTQNSQYMFGSEFLVAPCITEGASNTITYLPRDSGTWIHLVSICSIDTLS
jgi:alpha-glucosidase (family GH31 glycosyl hydrolase)